MTIGKQIEEYERAYHVVYGTFGEEPNLVTGAEGPDWPIWRARLMVVALVKTQIEKLMPDDPERGALVKILTDFQQAMAGEVVWGMIRKWRNRNGVERFIGLVERGRDYRAAGQSRTPVRTSTRWLPDPAPTIPVRRTTPEQTEAERIAEKMAKAARKAVEGDPNNE